MSKLQVCIRTHSLSTGMLVVTEMDGDLSLDIS